MSQHEEALLALRQFAKTNPEAAATFAAEVGIDLEAPLPAPTTPVEPRKLTASEEFHRRNYGEQPVELVFKVTVSSYGKPHKVAAGVLKSLQRVCGLEFKHVEVAQWDV